MQCHRPASAARRSARRPHRGLAGGSGTAGLQCSAIEKAPGDGRRCRGLKERQPCWKVASRRGDYGEEGNTVVRKINAPTFRNYRYLVSVVDRHAVLFGLPAAMRVVLALKAAEAVADDEKAKLV